MLPEIEVTSESNVKFNVALSILEKLHVPDGWCSKGLIEKLNKLIPSFGVLLWVSYACKWL